MTVRELRVPSLSSDDDKENSSEGWDKTIEFEWKQSSAYRPPICRHGVAVGSNVHGTMTTDQDGNWLTWKRSFAPGTVCRLVSNSDGTVLAATTDGGSVSLLRGKDGRILATRKISSSMAGKHRPSQLLFVSGGKKNETTNDVLLVSALSDPNGDVDADAHIIIVSDIDGQRLNNGNQNVVADAARGMSINTYAVKEVGEIVSMEACFVTETTIRLALIDGRGNLSLHNYDTSNNKGNPAMNSVELGKGRRIATEVELVLQHIGSTNSYLLVCAHGQTSVHLIWYDILKMCLACTYEVVEKGRLSRKVLGLLPLVSWSKHSAAAVAIAFGPTDDGSSDVKFQIVQVSVEETMGLLVLSNPHFAFEILSGVDARLMDTLALSLLDGEPYGPYSFRQVYSMKHGSFICRDFVGSDQRAASVGEIRQCLANNDVDAAEGLVSKLSPSQTLFETSEVALRRLQSLLRRPNMDETTRAIAQTCLAKLSHAALSGREKALFFLLEAAGSVIEWPSQAQSAVSVSDFLTALSVVQSVLATMANSSTVTSSFEDTRRKLEDRRETFHCLREISGVRDDCQIDESFHRVSSVANLFQTLIESRLFTATRRLWKSKWGPKVTPEFAISCFLAIPTSVDPRLYIDLLCEAGILRLSVKHEALPLVSAWACRAADEMDAANPGSQGLQASLFLLERVLAATNQLNAKVLQSFSSYSPFVGRNDPRSPQQTSSSFKNASFESTSSVSLLKARGSRIGSRYSVPTILELGMLKGGAMKSGLAGVHTKALLASYADEENDNDVEIKLRCANQLALARDLGLPKKSMSLKEFMLEGGPKKVAVRLLHLSSKQAENDLEREEYLASKVMPYCQSSKVSYDEALMDYIQGICDKRTCNLASIGEAAAVTRTCQSSVTRCQTALTVLRAALFAGISSQGLKELSQDAIELAGGNDNLKSELVEASRLLTIDGIVRRYCGAAATELFRVDNTMHATRLLEYVCRHVTYERVIGDALDLCGAFTHLSKTNACVQLMQNAVLCEKPELCSSLFSRIVSVETNVAELVFERTIAFCSLQLRDSSTAIGAARFPERKEAATKGASAVCSTAISLFEEAQSLALISRENKSKFDTTFSEYRVISRLQDQYQVFVSPGELRSERFHFEFVVGALRRMGDAFSAPESSLDASSFEDSMDLCKLVVGSSPEWLSELWYSAMLREGVRILEFSVDSSCIQFFRLGGIVDQQQDRNANRIVLMLTKAIFSAAGQAMDDVKMPKKTVLRMLGDALLVLKCSCLVHCAESTLDTVVSLCNAMETLTFLLFQSDEGYGEEFDSWMQGQLSKRPEAMAPQFDRTRTTNTVILHPSWYVGDGLLLPVERSIVGYSAFAEHLFDFCTKTPLAFSTIEDFLKSSSTLYALLDERGAYSSCLRIGCLTVSTLIASYASLPSNQAHHLQKISLSYQRTMKALSERGLGGGGNGITNPFIDSQLAVGYLFLLSKKLAFQVYKACLPLAVSKRDFQRVLTLGNIGVVACGGSNEGCNWVPGYTIPATWRNQQVLLSQCRKLSLQARWWLTLQQYQVEFDPRRFDTKSGDDKTFSDDDSQYVATLLPQLIEKSSLSLRSMESVVQLATSFGTTFGLYEMVAHQKVVAFALGAPVACSRDESASTDLRHDLPLCEATARSSLKYIPSQLRRLAILRKCVATLELREECYADYERYAMLMSLYKTELLYVVDQDPVAGTMNSEPFEEELELVERRADALAVLTSFFQGDQKALRPPYPKFFQTLPSHDGVHRQALRGATIEDLCESKGVGAYFEPLLALNDFIGTHHDHTTATALAPLCIPLGLPTGYIHARFLMERFHQAEKTHGTPPSFEQDVQPVLSRLRCHRDQCILAEWCSLRYVESDEQKMRCIERALASALKVSNDVENKRKGDQADDMRHQESALDVVKRLTATKCLLADKLNANRVLRSSMVGGTTQYRQVKRVIEDLVLRLNAVFWGSSVDRSPEHYVEQLLSESSEAAFYACVNDDSSFSIGHLRYMATTVHQACKTMSEQYSHVHTGNVARKLVKRWLLHGDSTNAAGTGILRNDLDVSRENAASMVLHDDEDTINFVMDLRAGHDDSTVWSGEVGFTTSENIAEEKNVSSEEEARLLSRSARDISEDDSLRIAIRVAFVMSFSAGYHSADASGELSRKENRTASTKARFKLSQHLNTSDSIQDRIVVAHARELLRIVFAQSVGSKANSPVLSEMPSSVEPGAWKSVTFVTRYRALRAAGLLCPQPALERVMKDDGFITQDLEASCLLEKCSFGSFVAKEIEEMGLPLPHSNLIQLSTMHFPSYARALWRHHRSGGDRNSRGRLYLLLLEMSTHQASPLDAVFTTAVLQEMTKLFVPRSLLQGCEAIAKSLGDGMDNEEIDVLLKPLGWLCDVLRREITDASIKTSNGAEDARHAATSTVRRIRHLCEGIKGNASQKAALLNEFHELTASWQNGSMIDIPIAQQSGPKRLLSGDAIDPNSFPSSISAYLACGEQQHVWNAEEQ